MVWVLLVVWVVSPPLASFLVVFALSTLFLSLADVERVGVRFAAARPAVRAAWPAVEVTVVAPMGAWWVVAFAKEGKEIAGVVNGG